MGGWLQQLPKSNLIFMKLFSIRSRTSMKLFPELAKMLVCCHHLTVSIKTYSHLGSRASSTQPNQANNK
jgi:hypothetical protein